MRCCAVAMQQRVLDRSPTPSYTCDFNCGFIGSFHEVADHEMLCQLQPRPRQSTEKRQQRVDITAQEFEAGVGRGPQLELTPARSTQDRGQQLLAAENPHPVPRCRQIGPLGQSRHRS